MSSDNQSLQTAIYQALTSGSSIRIKYDQFDISGGKKVISHSVSFKGYKQPGTTADTTYPGIKSVLSASSLADGTSLTDLIPANSPYVASLLSKVCLMEVNFTLYAYSEEIGSFECVIGLGYDGEGVSWNPFTRVDHFSATLKSLSLGVINPYQKTSQRLIAAIEGELDIGESGRFEVVLSFPQIELQITQVPNTYCSVKDVLSALGITTGSGDDFFDKLLKLAIDDFYLQANISEQSATIRADIVELDGEYTKPVPIELIPDILALDELDLSFSYQPGTTSAGLIAKLELLNKDKDTALKFSIGANYTHSDTTSTLTLSGTIDVLGTLVAWQSQTSNLDTSVNLGAISGSSKLMLKDLCTKLFGFSLPTKLGDLYIGAMSASYTRSSSDGTGNSAYSFYGVVGGDWKVSGVEIKAQIQINLSNADNAILCDFDFKGFLFELGYDFTRKEGSVAIPALAGLTGTYDFESEKATITFGDEINIEALVEWFVASVTGNPGFEFGPPWNKVLGEVSKHVSKPENRNVLENGKGLSFTICLMKGSRYVEVYLPIGAVKLPFDIAIKAVSIKYTEGDDPTKSALSFSLDGNFPFLVMADGSSADKSKLKWDPSQPGTEPTVSGLGSSLLDIQVIALGQRVSYPSAPDRVEDAINQLITALQPEEGSDVVPIFPKKLEFNPDSSWLIGNRFVLLGQMVAELIFNDPLMYGAMVKIDKVEPPSTGNAKLNAFAGLYFEIMYRKLTDNIGEYYVALTLPEQFRSIDLGEVVIHLPSFSLAVYTNGNFKIDIGFPYKADFSLSFGATYLVFTGLGGFYFGSLDGVTAAKSLPCYDKEHWRANPVIEVGIGIAVGVQRGFSAGPMEAKLTVMLQAILQGIFVEFRRTSESSDNALLSADNDKREVLYYKAKGVIRFVGELTGTVDLAVISASFTVQVILSASLTIEEYKKSEAELSASVKIKLSVKVGVGVFSFHVHVSFHHTISTSFSFGSKSRPVYLGPDCPGYSELLLTMVESSDATLNWASIKPDSEPQELTVYFVPQLTFADSGLAASTPHYVNMLYLSYPNSVAGTELSNEENAFQNFASGVFLWLINAYHGNGESNPVATIKSWSFKKSDLLTIDQLLSWSDQQFESDQLNTFTSNYFKLVISVPETKGEYGVCGFPLPDGFDIKSSLSGTLSAMEMTADYIQMLKGLQPDTHLGHIATENKSSRNGTKTASTNQHLLMDYVLTTARQLANAAAVSFTTDTESQTVSELLDYLCDNTSATSPIDHCAGFLSRFLLHGMRKPESASEDAPRTALFNLTGQQFEVSGNDDTLSITLSSDAATPPAWQVEYPAGATNLVVDSNSTDLVLSPKALKTVVHKFQPTVKTAGELSILKSRDQLYQFNIGAPAKLGATDYTMWQLPNELLKTIADHDSNLSFSLHQLALSTSKASNRLPDSLPGISVGHKWFTTIKFKVRQIKAVNSGAGQADFLKNAYEFAGTDAANLFKLVELLGTALGTGVEKPSISSVNLGFEVNGGNSFIPLDTTSRPPFSLVQTNLSTESRPENTPAALKAFTMLNAGATPLENFLAMFWAASITNNGGYYLHYEVNGDGIPDSLFSGSGGTADLSLAIEVAGTDEKLGSYINAFATEDATTAAEADTEVVFFAQCDQIKEVRATIDPGHVGIEVVRNAPPVPPSSTGPTTDYSASLTNLYTLLTCYVKSVGSHSVGLPVHTSGIGPHKLNSDSDSTDGDLYFKKILPLAITTNDVPSISDPDLIGCANPYAAVGQSVEFFSCWTDLYGNFLADPKVGLDPFVNGYFDPVPKLAGLPNLAFVYSFAKGDASPSLKVEFLFKQHAYDPLIKAVQDAYGIAEPLVPAEKWTACKTLEDRILVIDEQLETEDSSTASKALNKARQMIFDSARKLENDGQKYAYLYYQLLPYSSAEKQATVLISSKILKPTAGEKSNGSFAYEGDELRNNSKAIYEYLLDLYNALGQGQFGLNNLLVVLEPMIVSSGFETENLLEDYFYVLDLAISIKRNGSINKEFHKVADVNCTTTSVPAKPDKWDATESNPVPRLMVAANNTETTTPAYTYTGFASDFSDAFAASSMQVATGVVWDSASNAQGKQLWVVRYGSTGLELTFDANETAVFSAAPISTQLESKAGIALKEVYDPGTGTMKETKDEISVGNLDMDASMRAFLARVEQYLSPEYAVPAAQIPVLDDGERTPFEILISAKAAMAEKLKTTITNQNGGKSFGDVPANKRSSAMFAVAEKLKQECLTSLNNYYQISALVSTQIKGSFNLPGVAAHGDPIPMNVFGNPDISGVDGNLSLTSAKTSIIQGTTQLAFGVKAHKLTEQAVYKQCNLAFNLGALEHGMESVPVDGTEYKSGSWLQFLNKQSSIPIGETEIAIPLRAYPKPPSLIAQSFAPTLGSGGSGENPDPKEILKQAKEWSFDVRYNHSYTAQDHVYVRFTLNPVPAGSSTLAAVDSIPLIDALARFATNYSLMEPTLSSLSAANISDSKVQQTFHSFAELVTLVASAIWPSSNNANDAQMPEADKVQSPPPSQNSTYRIAEGANLGTGKIVDTSEAEDKTTEFYMKVTEVGAKFEEISTLTANLPLATVSGMIPKPVPGETGVYQIFHKDGTPVSLGEAETLNSRTITKAGINLIDHQAGISAVRIGRNEDDFPSNFWYETPFVSFPDHILPHLDESTPIPITDWLKSGSEKLIKNYLSAAVGEILKDSEDKFTEQLGGLKVVCYYEYQLQEKLSAREAQTISIPVKLAIPLQCTLDPSNDKPLGILIGNIGDALNQWTSQNKPAHWDDTMGELAKFRFDLSVFSDNSVTGQPLMRLRNLYLPSSVVKIEPVDS